MTSFSTTATPIAQALSLQLLAVSKSIAINFGFRSDRALTVATLGGAGDPSAEWFLQLSNTAGRTPRTPQNRVASSLPGQFIPVVEGSHGIPLQPGRR